VHYVNKQTIPVVIETLQSRIKGKVHVLYNHRPSDLLNSKEQFIAVTEATIWSLHEDRCLGERPCLPLVSLNFSRPERTLRTTRSLQRENSRG